MLWQVRAPHLCAGLITEGITVRRAAPILKYMTGWPIDRVINYCSQEGWQIVLVEPIS